MIHRFKSLFTNVYKWIISHKAIAWTASTILSFIIGWLLSFIFPAKPVIASNIPKKELTCILNYSQHIIKKTVSDNRLQILYDGKQAEDPCIYNISIENSGSIEVDNSDFKTDFVIEFRNCGKILSAEVSKSSSIYAAKEVLSNAKILGEDLVISDFFLNPGESFTISVITDRKAEGINYKSRISGISKLTLRNTPKEKRGYFSSVMMFIFAIVIIVVILLIILSIRERKKWREESNKFLQYQHRTDEENQ